MVISVGTKKKRKKKKELTGFKNLKDKYERT